ncbi:aldo/keto reductase (plasmid) [Phyllobacterium sp. A18/5-2]|uniref:aldo/keto reductase n=1 Tax=Phyllobacterium sp. A18/5-2 TaxID=2978392 RepID=UPI0021C9E35F|nr:aldo/keto reductase [Phyllobacterium sp. A18/5-2]UXN66200.1 aldo/keto reductase [Phyllobacterium sp. A18/5-2]
MRIGRRMFLEGALIAGAGVISPSLTTAQPSKPLTRQIPSSHEAIAAVGLGSWITFNVGDDTALMDDCAQVMAAFFAAGGHMIDCSPMYGSSQPVIGYGLEKLGHPKSLFSAEKVWTSSGASGPEQIERSRRYWGVPRFDLVQVHNLLSWEAHLKTLIDMRTAGQVRYFGVTTSDGRRHDLLEQIMRTQPLDFVQFSYNVVDREPEQRLLPLAAERGIAVIVNRPFQQGRLIRRLARDDVPEWAAEIGASTWAQFILKYIVSHPAVTVAIPATTSVDHVRENVDAARGVMPDAAMRARMVSYVQDL